MSLFFLVWSVLSVVYAFLAHLSIFLSVIASFICALLYYSLYLIAGRFLLVKDVPAVIKALSFALLIVIYEWIRTNVLAMPWGNLYEIGLNVPFIKYIAVILGRYGLSFIVAFLITGFLLEKKVWRYLLYLSFALLIAAFGMFQSGRILSKYDSSIMTAMLESGFSYREKISAGFSDTIDLYRRGIRNAPADIVFLPETAVNVPLGKDEAQSLICNALTEGRDIPIVFGAVRRAADGRFYNSAFLCGADEEKVYDKRRLVPFGEFVPFRGLPIVNAIYNMLSPVNAGDFSKGSRAVIWDTAGIHILPLICYEDSFSGLARPYYKKANAVVVLTSDIWFGSPLAQIMHKNSSRALSMESGLPVVRSSTAGPSCIFMPNGKVIYGDSRLVDINGFAKGRVILARLVFPRNAYSFYYETGSKILLILLILCGIIIRYYKPQLCNKGL